MYIFKLKRLTKFESKLKLEADPNSQLKFNESKAILDFELPSYYVEKDLDV